MISSTKHSRTFAEIVVVHSPTRVRKFVRECMRLSHQKPIPAVLGVCGGQSGLKNLIKNPHLKSTVGGFKPTCHFLAVKPGPRLPTQLHPQSCKYDRRQPTQLARVMNDANVQCPREWFWYGLR